MASLSNQSKNTASVANVQFGEELLTWDEANFTWDGAPGTWDFQNTVLSNVAKNSASITNQAKN